MTQVAVKPTTSEERLGFAKPPEHQCPTIDKIIKAVRWIDKNAGKNERLDEEELRSLLDDIERELWGVESDLESIRSACEGLREWGESWKTLAKNMSDELNVDLEDYA